MMSALAGILYADRRPVPAHDLAVFTTHSQASGPDGGGTFTAPGVALQAHILRFDRWSGAEQQPYRFGREAVLTWDGRLDNRDDLLMRLDRQLGADHSDAALVAAAYEQWGEACLPRLLGDWSLAIWDETTRSLLLARDYMGNRPLFYVHTAECFAWATCLDALLDRFDLYGNPSDAYIAGLMTFGVRPEMTPFQSAYILRAGHKLVLHQSEAPQPQRYWTYEPNTIRYRRADDYTDHLRSLLTDAVRVRLRAERSVWAHLSGGWDSSSIVCLAHRLIQQGQVDAPALQPLSGVCRDSPESDESPFIAAVERWCGVTSVRHELQTAPSFAALRGHRRLHPYLPAWHVEAAVQAAGDRVVLSGELGDGVMLQNSGDFISLLEPLHAGHPLRSLRLCIAFARHRQDQIWPLLRRLARSYLPAAGRERRRQRLALANRAKERRVSVRDVAKIFGVPSALLARTVPLAPPAPPPSGFPHVKQSLVTLLYRCADHGALSNSDLLPDVRRTYPYAHRPLVEFILATPQLAFWDPLIYRFGMRTALQDVLPPEILSRTSKGNPTAVGARSVQPLLEELKGSVSHWQLVQRGYVDERALTQALAKSWQGSPADTGFVTHCATLEAWLSSLPVAAGALPPSTAADQHDERAAWRSRERSPSLGVASPPRS